MSEAHSLNPRKNSAVGGCFVLSVVYICIFGLSLAPCSVVYYTNPLYRIYPQNCNMTLFSDYPSWHIGEWVIIPSLGACPMNGLDFYDDYCSSCSNSNDDNRRKLGVTNSHEAYDYCMTFNSESSWSNIDDENAVVGYSSSFLAGSTLWASSINLIVIAQVFYWLLVFFCFFYLYFSIQRSLRYDNIQWVQRSIDDIEAIFSIIKYWCFFPVLPVLLPVAFVGVIQALQQLVPTDQLNPSAWEAAFFASCDVLIEKNTSSFSVIYYSLIVNGLIVLVFYGGLACFLRDDFRRKHQFTRQKMASIPIMSPLIGVSANDVATSTSATATTAANSVTASTAIATANTSAKSTATTAITSSRTGIKVTGTTTSTTTGITTGTNAGAGMMNPLTHSTADAEIGMSAGGRYDTTAATSTTRRSTLENLVDYQIELADKASSKVLCTWLLPFP